MKIRGLAERLRRESWETADVFYKRMFQGAALDLESAAEKMERSNWASPHSHH